MNPYYQETFKQNIETQDALQVEVNNPGLIYSFVAHKY